MSFSINKALANAIERIQDPLAAIKMQEGYSNVCAVGKLLTPMTEISYVEYITKRLLSDFTDAELDKANPAFAIALSGLLAEALIRIGRSFADDPSV